MREVKEQQVTHGVEDKTGIAEECNGEGGMVVEDSLEKENKPLFNMIWKQRKTLIEKTGSLPTKVEIGKNMMEKKKRRREKKNVCEEIKKWRKKRKRTKKREEKKEKRFC